MEAVRDVRPMQGKGRALPLPLRPERPGSEACRDESLADFLRGKFEFSLEYTDEFMEGRVLGLDPLIMAKLRAGRYSPEKHLDLHGLNAEQARERLLLFIRGAYNQGLRSLLVVTGRGLNSPGGLGILRGHMREWLTRDPLKRVVQAFCTAKPKDGGSGALYVLLRRYKKSNGKIRWDSAPTEENPLL
jgi:DNA-nicking Smr family endonuclease